MLILQRLDMEEPVESIALVEKEESAAVVVDLTDLLLVERRFLRVSESLRWLKAEARGRLERPLLLLESGVFPEKLESRMESNFCFCLLPLRSLAFSELSQRLAPMLVRSEMSCMRAAVKEVRGWQSKESASLRRSAESADSSSSSIAWSEERVMNVGMVMVES